MKISKFISVIAVSIIMFNVLGTTAFAAQSNELVDSNTGYTGSTVLNQRVYTENDKREESTSALITEPVNEENVTGRTVDGTLVHEENFKVDSYLKGTSAKMETTFSVGEWKVNEVQLTLVYSASQFIDNTKSSFTVLVNGVRCVTEAQPSTYGERSQIKLTLPPSELKLGINTLSIEADILTTGVSPDTAGSIESGWFNVFKDSTVAIAYEPLNSVTNIKEFYEKFVSIESLDFKQSAIVVPEKATNAELQNAMYAMSGVSKNTALYFQNIGFDTAGSLAELEPYNNVIYVASYYNLPDDFKSLLSDWQKNQAEQSAVITLVKSGEQNILVVTGKREAAVANATHLLSNAELMSQMNYTDRGVGEEEGYEPKPEPFEQYKTLTQTGTMVEGESIQSANYYVDFPYNRSITDKSQVYLVFRYADNLDFDRSLMTVYLNETPIASKRLNQSSAARDEVTFHIPTDIAVAGNFVIRVAFDLRVNGSGGATPWAFISPESTLKINSASQPFLVFENYPSPFIKDGTFNDVLAVIPENPTTADLEVLSQTFCLFGQYMDSSAGNLTVVRDTDIFDVADKNVITIGVQSKNKYTQSLNDSMFFKFSKDGTYMLSNEKMMIDPEFSKDLGTIQLLRSASAEDHAILVIAGTSEKGLLAAASYFKTPDYAWKVFGDGFVADMQEIHNFKFKEDNAQSLSIPSKLRFREDLTSLLIVLSMLGLIIVLSFVFMVVRYRKGGTRIEK